MRLEGDLVCCNDDADCGVTGYQSFMENVFLYAGNTYYFVVDGYGGDCGDYVFEVLPQAPCDVTSPSGAIPENEPPCGPGYVDSFNGGCNSDPPVFQDVFPSTDTINIFGKSGTYDDYSRDTDWYQIDVTEPNTVTFSAVAARDIERHGERVRDRIPDRRAQPGALLAVGRALRVLVPAVRPRLPRSNRRLRRHVAC